jgi:hypothetical protein
MTVGIGFDHCHESGGRGNEALHIAAIMGNGLQINFSPYWMAVHEKLLKCAEFATLIEDERILVLPFS